MAVSQINNWVVMILMIMLVMIQFECIAQSQEFKLNKINEPWCEIKCNFVCVGKRLDGDWDACVADCKKTKC